MVCATLRLSYAGPIRHGYHFVTTFVLFRPAQTTMPCRPLKKEVRTRKFLERISIYIRIYAYKADIGNIGENAKVKQTSHNSNSTTHETSRKCITSEIEAHLFDESVFDVLGITSKDLPTISLPHFVCDHEKGFCASRYGGYPLWLKPPEKEAVHQQPRHYWR